MADQVSTFKAVCRGGLNTGSDELSLGTEASGAANQLVNYEPNLEGGYRKISGYAHSFGTVTGTGSVLGIAVANGINQGILACRTPSSGNNYLHHWNFYYQFNVASDVESEDYKEGAPGTAYYYTKTEEEKAAFDKLIHHTCFKNRIRSGQEAFKKCNSQVDVHSLLEKMRAEIKIHNNQGDKN